MANSAFFKQVAAAALNRFDAVIGELGLAGGKHSGAEYLPLNPKRDDHSAGSLSINRNKGAWMEGATGDKGGDLVSLAAYVWSCSQSDAAERLGKFLGIAAPERQQRARRSGGEAGKATAPAATENPASAPQTAGRDTQTGACATPKATGAEDGECIMPAPDNAPPPPALQRWRR